MRVGSGGRVRVAVGVGLGVSVAVGVKVRVGGIGVKVGSAVGVSDGSTSLVICIFLGASGVPVGASITVGLAQPPTNAAMRKRKR